MNLTNLFGPSQVKNDTFGFCSLHLAHKTEFYTGLMNGLVITECQSC